MKWTKTFYTLTFILPITAQAHEVWVDTDYPMVDNVLQVNIGYGDFPTLATIAEDRLHIFRKPAQLHTPQGTTDLVQQGKHNFHFVTPTPLAKGSYLVTAEYSPTFWSKNKEGWKQVNMESMPDASYCEQTQMYGKKVVNIGGSKEIDFVTKPIGQGLEIIPLDNPAYAKVGIPFPLQVLFNGKPIEGETVVATFKGFAPKDPNDHYHKLEPQAFSDTTRADGTVKLYPWHAGQWKIRVVHKSPYPDPNQCQNLASYATLTFDVSNKPEGVKAFYADDKSKYTNLGHKH